MNNVVSENTYRDLVRFVSQNRKVKAALKVGAAVTAIVGSIYLAKWLFSGKRVHFFGQDKTIDIISREQEPFPIGYSVQHPIQGPCIAIVEAMTDEAVTLRFQDDKETIDPTDYLVIYKKEFDSWEPKKIW